MVIDGYTTARFRTWSTDSVKHRNDVGMLLPYQVYNRTAYCSFKSEVSNTYGYKHQADRSAEIDAVRFKGIIIECANSGQLYN